MDDPASSHDAAYASESYDFHEDGTPPAPPIDIQQLISRFRSLDLRVRVLEAERSGAQQALWHHHRAASDSQRLRSRSSSPCRPIPPRELEKFCKDHAVHEVLAQAPALKGLESVDDFAYAFPEIRSLESLLSGLSDSDLSDMGSTDQFHGVHAAKLRKALRFAHDLCQQPTEPAPHVQQPPSLPAAILPQASPASWVENLPPKLSPEAAQELIDDFKTNYPGELLDEDTMPSIRLLSLVQHSLKPGEKIRWIPWQFRLSSKQYTEIMEAKSSKPMRAEAQLLASALYDDTPEMPVAHLRLAASWLSRIQTVYRNAWALCGAAHLNNLKAFDKRVLDLALPDLADNSLRGPTTQELLAADRNIWGSIGSLVSSGWSLDDEALYEVTSIRSDLSNLLQPRPRNALPSTPNKGRERPNTPTPPPPKRTRTTPFTLPKNRKGKGKGGKQGKGLANKAKSEDWPSNWVYKAHGKVLCKRYQRSNVLRWLPYHRHSGGSPFPAAGPAAPKIAS